MKPKRQERLGDYIYGQILEQIVSGALPEGGRLPSEKEMCNAFQVSRPVVREALMRLQADRVVVSRQGQGSFVERRPGARLLALTKASDVAGLLRSYEVRIALESETAALAAQRHTPAQFSNIAAAFEKWRANVEQAQLSPPEDFEFHRTIADASGNEVFVFMLDALQPIMENAMAVVSGILQGKMPWMHVRD